MVHKRTILILSSAALVLTAVQMMTGVFYAMKPKAWNSVQIGMSRDDVFAAVGAPTVNTADLKGQDSWKRMGLFNERTLIVRYDASRTVERVGERFYWRLGSE